MQPFITKHKDTLLGLLFLAFFSATVAFATRTTPFSPGETLNPNCAPDDPNCYVQLTSNTNQNSGGSSNQSSDGTITGTNLNITGVPATIAVPDGVLGASLQYGTEHGYPDNGYAHNYRVYSYKNTPGGKIFSSTYVTLPIPSGSIGDPANLTATQVDGSGGFHALGSVPMNYRIYTYKDVPGGRIYSTGYTTLTTDFDNNNDNTDFGISLSWDAVDGATGYRILKYAPAFGMNYDQGIDVLGNSFIDTGTNVWKNEAAITTSNGIFDQNQAQQLYTVNLSWNPVPGADGYRVIASNQNNNIGGESAYFGSLSETYDAGYDTTATSLIDDACYTVCFDPTKADVSNNSGYSNLAILNGTFQISGPLVISKNGYINWGATAGTDGYGIRDNNGVMEYKDVGGSWTAITGGGATSGLSLDSGYSFIANGYPDNGNLYESVVIGQNAGYTLGSDNPYNVFIGAGAGQHANSAQLSVFIGSSAGEGASNVENAIFIGDHTAYYDPVYNRNGDYSIVIGNDARTGGYSNSIAIGKLAQNTAANQFMVGSNIYPIGEFVIHDSMPGYPIGYINFNNGSNNNAGVDGYGIRDNGGTLEYKNNGGSWTAFGGGSGAPTLDGNNSFIVGPGSKTTRSNFLGDYAGYSAPNADYSNFLGFQSGISAINAYNSNFFGTDAGAGATYANHSNFLGAYAGYGAFNAHDSNFFGSNNGYNASQAYDSNFIGSTAGYGATNANYSNFLGVNAGQISINAYQSNFLGANAGNNAANAANSIFIGNNAGQNDAVNNTFNGHSILIGDNTSTGSYSNSIAIGSNARNTKTNQLVFGSSDYPISDLSINNVNYTFPASQGSAGQTLVNDGNGVLSWQGGGGGSIDSHGSFHIGGGDSLSTNYDSNFIGNGAGQNATNADLADFIGTSAGSGATNAEGSNFIGYRAGEGAANAPCSDFIGARSGANAVNAGCSNFLGVGSGYRATNAAYSNFIGISAGDTAVNAASSIFIGTNAGQNDAVNNTSNSGFSILIGNSTSTGGYSNSIAIGSNATNTATNQFMIGSSGYPVNTTVIKGSGSTQCTITTGTGIACSSDITLKKNITAIPDGMLAKVLSLNPVTYNWKTQLDTDPTYAGFIAQQVEPIFPQAVSTDPSTGTKLLSPTVLIPFTIKAIQEMDIQMQGLASLKGDSGNTFKDALIAWFADVHNGINKLFVREIDTTKICVSDTTGATCITKGQLDKLLAR